MIIDIWYFNILRKDISLLSYNERSLRKNDITIKLLLSITLLIFSFYYSFCIRNRIKYRYNRYLRVPIKTVIYKSDFSFLNLIRMYTIRWPVLKFNLRGWSLTVVAEKEGMFSHSPALLSFSLTVLLLPNNQYFTAYLDFNESS